MGTLNDKPELAEAIIRCERGQVRSKDGTPIGYRQLGSGPGLVILHGAMESSTSHLELAAMLAASYRVIMPDRRGRGSSGPYRSDTVAAAELEDLEALLSATGARFFFGVSAGATIGLHAARSLPGIDKAALYEPALSIDGSLPAGFLARFDREMASGRVAAALVTGMKGARMGPPVFNLLPRGLLEGLTKAAMKKEDRSADPGTVTMRQLAPTLHYDFRLVLDSEAALGSFAEIRRPVLLLGGSDSPAYLKTALARLEAVLPQLAGRVEFPGLGHGGSGNADRGGRPAVVAAELARFFV